MSVRRTWILVPLILGAVLVSPLNAYLKIGTAIGNGQVVGIVWTHQPIRYFVKNRDANGVTAGQLQTTLTASFDQWTQPANVDLATQFGGFTNAEPFDEDGLTVVGFQSHPEFDRTLGATTFVIDDQTGEILESDIFLNTSFQWSVAANGQAGRFDVGSVLTHEVGHLLGLGHSAIGETQLVGSGRAVIGKRAVMFPIAFGPGSTRDRTLEADDIAGITDIYGNGTARQTLGAIAGRVTLNGAGVFGAHVTAFNPVTGQLVSGFSLTPQGDFVIDALTPGHYIVRVEPLDDADQDSFFDEEAPVSTNFQVTYYARQVAVPAGGSSGSIEIKVKAK
jgi:hypothetical protein